MLPLLPMLAQLGATDADDAVDVETRAQGMISVVVLLCGQ